MKHAAPALCAMLALIPTLAAAQTPPPAPGSAQSDNAVDDRIRASADAAQSYQGSLDGAWTLVAANGGKALYDFQLVEKAGGAAPLEGVWRDLRRPSVPGDINVIDTLVRGPQTLSIALAAPGQPRVTIELKSDPAGAWTGEMLEAGMLVRVRLRRG